MIRVRAPWAANWAGSSKGQTVPEFEKAAFSLQPGQTSGLVKTAYGYHILQVEQHEQARLQPFDEVKGQLTADYMQQYANDQMQKLADKTVASCAKIRCIRKRSPQMWAPLIRKPTGSLIRSAA